MAIKTIRVFAEYTSDGYVPMPSQGNIDYGVTLGSTFPETEPSSYQTDDPNIDVAVTTMTDFYVWIRTHGSSWNPSYTRVVRVYPDSPSVNSVVMNMIVAVGGGGTSINAGGGVTYYLNGGTSQGILDGSTYYEMSKTPVEGAMVDFFKINTTNFENIAQFVTDAGDPSLLKIPPGAWPLGFYFSASDNSGSPKFYAEIYKYSAAGVFTLLGSSVASPEVISNGVAIDYYTTSVTIPDTTLLITDRIAIRIFVDTDGNRTVNFHTQDAHLATVGTTFANGLTAINGLTKQVQFINIGTAGSDAAIVSSDDTHTINLPTASSTKRGLLNSTDWSTFNAKQAALSGTGFVKIDGSTISYDNSSYQPLDGDLTAIGALAGTTGILKKTGANTWELDTTTYLSTGVAASTYQRLDKMVSNLLASDTEYPNSNAVLAKLALKANAENPEFTGYMTVGGAYPKIYLTDSDNNPDYFIGNDDGYFRIYDQTNTVSRFYITSLGVSTFPGSVIVGSIAKSGGLSTEFLKADGTVDATVYATSASLADYLTSATAATTYQRKDKMVSNLLASDTEYPNSNAVLAKLALKADAANPSFTGSMNISGAESRVNFYDENAARKYYIGYDSGFLRIYQDAGSTSRFYINSSGKTFIPGTLEVGTIIKTSGTASQFLKADGSVDSNTYVSSTSLANYLLITDAVSTYQRKDKMVSNLLASDTEYPNSNAVIAALALKANAANPTFTGDFTISGATPRLYFVDTDNNPDYTLFTDSGYFYIYNQTAGSTKFSINSDGNTVIGGSLIGSTASFTSNIYSFKNRVSDGFITLTTASSNAMIPQIEQKTESSVIGSYFFLNRATNVSAINGFSLTAWRFTTDFDVTTGNLIEVMSNYNQRFTVNHAGAGLFASSVTASSFVKSGGTSSQFLKADGSIDSDAYVLYDSDSEQLIGLRQAYFNHGIKRMNIDPRWNESGYDSDLGCFHIWAWSNDGASYGRAGIALYNGSAYQYLSTKGSQNNIYLNNNAIWHAGNLTNLNQLTNGPGYITAEADTLATVTGRGFTTSASVRFGYYVDVAPTLSAFRFYDGTTFRGGFGTDGWANGGSDANISLYVNGNNTLFFYSNGVKRAYVDSSAFNSLVALQQNGNQVWHAGNLTPGNYLPLAGGTMSGKLIVGYSDTAEPFAQAHFYNTNTSTPYGGLLVSGIQQGHLRLMYGSNDWNSASAKKWQIRARNDNSTDLFKIYSWGPGKDVWSISSSSEEYLAAEDNANATSRRYYNYASNAHRFYAVNASGTTTGVQLWEYDGSNYQRILNSSNYNSWALPITGGNISGAINFTSYTDVITIGHSSNNSGNIVFQQDGGTYKNIDFSAYYGMIGFFDVGGGGFRWRFGVNGPDKDILIHQGYGGTLISADGTYNGKWQGINLSSVSRKDADYQWIRPYYQYSDYLTSQGPSTLASQMGGSGGLRVDFAGSGYSTPNGSWAHMLTWSGYNRYSMNQIATDYYTTTPRLWYRQTYNHDDSWTSWREFALSDGRTYSLNATSANNVPWTGIYAGTRDNYDLSFQPNANAYAGFQFRGTNSANAGYLLVRGTSDNDVYTAEGITLVADQGWLSLAQRSTAGKGIRFMTGTGGPPVRFYIDTNGYTQFNITAGGAGSSDRVTFRDSSSAVNIDLVQYVAGGQAYSNTAGMFVSGGKDMLLMAGNANVRFVTGGYTEQMRLWNGGNLALGAPATDNGYKLQVSGSVIASGFYESSDLNLKNITNNYESEQFGAIEFNWKDNRDSKNHWGYIAQEVQKYIPDAVNLGKDGYLSVDYNQAHTFKIAKVEDEVTKLKKRVKELEKQLNIA